MYTLGHDNYSFLIISFFPDKNVELTLNGAGVVEYKQQTWLHFVFSYHPSIEGYISGPKGYLTK